MDRQDDATCFLCGQPGPDTREHVIPRCLHPGPLPSNALVVPAHRACNVSTSKDEELFLYHMSAVAFIAGDPRLIQKTKRALARPQARGMATTFYAGMKPLPTGGGTLSIELSVVHYVLAKIVKGVYFANTGRLLPGRDTRWVIRRVEDEFVAKTRFPNAYMVPNVVNIVQGNLDDGGLRTFWLIDFYNVTSRQAPS